MTNWKCTICPYETPSYRSLKEHCQGQHNAYVNKKADGSVAVEDITIQALNQLRTVKQQVHWLYTNKPQTKSDDELLILEHLKYFQDILIYTPESQRISFKDIRGITYEQFMYMVSPETITRCGRLIRAQDKKLYHDKDGNPTKEHLCLLGSPKAELRRQRREEIYRNNMKYL